MPLRRTPPKQLIASETDSESVDGTVSDLQTTDNQININTGRLKRKRENELSTFMDEVRHMFSKFASEQKARLDSLESSLTEIKTQNDAITLSMSTLSTKYDELQTELESFRQERKEHISYIELLENKLDNLERQSCVTKLEIRNIPKSQNESKEELCNVVKKIANTLNLQLQTVDIKDIYRPFAKPDVIKPIVVEFTSVLTKENLLKKHKKLTLQEKKEKLNTAMLGLESQQKPIYISECLTPKGRRLFFLARDFANSHEYTYCWTSYGKIYLRKKEGMPHIRIEEEADLAKLKVTI